jgi:hypothetical protein
LVGAFYFRYFFKNLSALAIDKNRVALHKSFQENKYESAMKVTSISEFYCGFIARFSAKQGKTYRKCSLLYL